MCFFKENFRAYVAFRPPPILLSCLMYDLTYNYILLKFYVEVVIGEGCFEYGIFKFENGEIEKQSGELKAKLELKANLT